MPWIELITDFLINRPLVLILLMAVPLFLISYFGQRYPTRRLFWVIGIPTLISLAIIQVPFLGWCLIILDLAILAVAAFDLFTIVTANFFSVERQVIQIASLKKSHDCELIVTNTSNHLCLVEVKDDLPGSFVATPDHFQYWLKPKSRASMRYSFTSHQRGRFTLECVYLRVASRLGLWQAYYSIPLNSQINVYPDLKQISEYDLLARTNRLNLLGVRKTRRIGSDNEFERLRDFRQDDNYKFIDWRSTARRNKLTVRDFQSNQSQRIIFMVDCGRMMTGRVGDISMLDHSLNAMLMLSYIALRQGDSVGLVCFSDSIHTSIPPRNGVKHLNRLLHASFDQHPKFVESRYDRAFLHLKRHFHKRALVVLITNVIDEINSNQIEQYMSTLTGRHLPLASLLRDHQMFDAIDNYQGGSKDLYTAAAAAKIATWRQQVITDLQHQGVLTLDVFPQQLTAQLVNQYLAIKAKHLL